MVEEWHILYLGSILHCFQMLVLQIYDFIRKDLEKCLQTQSKSKSKSCIQFSELTPGVLMELDFSDTYHSSGVVTLKTIKRFKRIYTKVLRVDC